MKPVLKSTLKSATAMRLTLLVTEKLGAEVHLTCLSTIPGFISPKADYLDYADYRTSSIIGEENITKNKNSINVQQLNVKRSRILFII